MIRKLLIWLRNFIDKLLETSPEYRSYTFSVNTGNLWTNTSGYVFTTDNNNTFSNCTFSGSHQGIDITDYW